MFLKGAVNDNSHARLLVLFLMGTFGINEPSQIIGNKGLLLSIVGKGDNIIDF